MYALDAESGERRWTFETARGLRTGPAVASGTVYVRNTDGVLYAVNAADGTEQWRLEMDGPTGSAPTVVGDTVYRRSRPSASGLDPEGEGRKPR
ncbi:PQQ-binding-like beta-propeller repeat protein (plasmid) [Halobacterium sp. MBLA0001]|uniref:outer membrane protein assembly factor BamB family protein n=1 Tax=Halobacterium TaxID=2239 RepID=UPI0009D95BA7|nr:PQQ-binding-like beta-propeller repeat protein [Halobacterium salinarum]